MTMEGKTINGLWQETKPRRKPRHPESELRALAGEEENKYEYYASIMALAILLDDKPPLAKELLEATLETINK